MIRQRVTWAAAARLVPRLSDRDWAIVRSLGAARALSGHQLSRLHFNDLSDLTRHRTRRRVLERLTAWQVTARLDRVIGGVRAGSTGWVFSLGPAGQRLLQLDVDQRSTSRIRAPWTPSTLFLRHSLDVAEIYVQLVEASRLTNNFALAIFETEPACWWPDGLGGQLKPDATIVLSAPTHDEVVWLEVDRSTESLPTLRRKLATYANFARRGQLGPSGVMPHVVVSTITEPRAVAVQAIIDDLDPANELFKHSDFGAVMSLLVDLLLDSSDVPP